MPVIFDISVAFCGKIDRFVYFASINVYKTLLQTQMCIDTYIYIQVYIHLSTFPQTNMEAHVDPL